MARTSSILESHLASSRSCLTFFKNMFLRRSRSASERLVDGGTALIWRVEKGVCGECDCDCDGDAAGDAGTARGEKRRVSEDEAGVGELMNAGEGKDDCGV